MRSNREKDLENIINEMYTHKIEIPANNTVEEDDTEETATDTPEEPDTEVVEDDEADASNPDKFECPKCGEVLIAAGCAAKH